MRYLSNICDDKDIILLHDAVEMNIDDKLIKENIECVKKYGSAVSAAAFIETGIISQDQRTTQQTISRNSLFIAKAPQSFSLKMFCKLMN